MLSEEAMDKAVEEALNEICPKGRIGSLPEPAREAFKSQWRPILDLLWQRAQEAEREENCKAVCANCRTSQPTYREGTAFNGGRWIDWFHAVEEVKGRPYDASCQASAIRNRAARAAEEPKP